MTRCPYCQHQRVDGEAEGTCGSCGRAIQSALQTSEQMPVSSDSVVSAPKTAQMVHQHKTGNVYGAAEESKDKLGSMGDRFSLPALSPIPKIPEPTIVQYVKYTYEFGLAWWQRKKALKGLGGALNKNNTRLQEVYVDLGRAARYVEPRLSAFAEELNLLDKLDERRFDAENAYTAVMVEKTEKTSRHELEDVERGKIIDGFQQELRDVESERSKLEDKKRDYEREQKELEKEKRNIDQEIQQGEANAASATDASLAAQVMVVLDKKRKSLEALSVKQKNFQEPIQEKNREIEKVSSKIRYLRDQIDNQKRRHKNIKQAHKQEEVGVERQIEELNEGWMAADRDLQSQYESFGRQCNLERVDHEELNGYFSTIDTLRSQVSKESGALARLNKEMEAYDKSSLIKGASAIGGGLLLVFIFLAVLF